MPALPPLAPEKVPDIVDEVADQIAKLNLFIDNEKKDWAGRLDLIVETARKHKIRRQDAEKCVDGAVDLLWKETPDSEPRVELRKAIRRLSQLRDFAYELMTNPRVKTKYNCVARMKGEGEKRDYVRNSKGEIQYDREPTEQTEERVVEIGLFDRIIQIETLLAKWQNLAQRGDPSLMARLLNVLESQSDDESDSEAITTTTLSVAQQVKHAIPTKAKKRIESRPVPKPAAKVSPQAPMLSQTDVIPIPGVDSIIEQAAEPASEPVGASEPILPAGPPPDADAEPIGN